MDTSWFVIALSGVLAGVAVVLGAVGLGGRWPAAASALVLAAASYALWRVGRDRMIARIHASVEPDGTGGINGTGGIDGTDGPSADRKADPEDWHREGYQYADADYDPESEGWDDRNADADSEASFFEGEFWHEREHAREREERADPDARADRSRSRGTRADGSGVETVDPATARACSILGVRPDADEAELKRAYRRRVKETHPDRGGSKAAFRRVREAYEHLRE